MKGKKTLKGKKYEEKEEENGNHEVNGRERNTRDNWK